MSHGPPRPFPAVNGDRLQRSIDDLAKIGSFVDDRTGLRGVNRLALSDADRDGRAQVAAWFREAGLEVRTDRIGNTYGRRRGTELDAAPVLAGSHIDSVPTGGAFDGVLGVLGALEVVRALNDSARTTRRPIEIGFFTDEEGCRFGTDMLGSAVACGRIALAEALSKTDKDGKSVGDELARIGWRGDHDERIAPPHAYVELHIEQGPILAHEGLDLGVVAGVQAISWQELTIEGKSAHAGTTPMSLRKDAGYAASLVNVGLHRMVASGDYGPDFRATMGRIDPHPGLVNIVPARVVCTVDLRNPDDEPMARAEHDLAGFLRTVEKMTGCAITSRQTARTPRVSFDERVMSIIDDRMTAHGWSHRPILSGAGHDAQEMAALCPTAMIFIPGLYDGISHNPREHSTTEACTRGGQVLLETMVTLADE